MKLDLLPSSESSRAFSSRSFLPVLNPCLPLLLYFSFVLNFILADHPADAYWERKVRPFKDNLRLSMSLLYSDLPLFD